MQQNLTPIIAALANSDCQRMYAQIVLGQAPESPNRRERKLIDRLKTVGLVTEDPAGSLILTDVFTEWNFEREFVPDVGLGAGGGDEFEGGHDGGGAGMRRKTIWPREKF